MATGGPRAAVDAFFEFVCPGLWAGIVEDRRDSYRANAGELLSDLQMPPYHVTAGDLANVQVPSLVIRGDRSHPALMRIADRLAEGVPEAELLELRGSGHVTYFEQPDPFADAVTAFVARRVSVPAG